MLICCCADACLISPVSQQPQSYSPPSLHTKNKSRSLTRHSQPSRAQPALPRSSPSLRVIIVSNLPAQLVSPAQPSPKPRLADAGGLQRAKSIVRAHSCCNLTAHPHPLACQTPEYSPRLTLPICGRSCERVGSARQSVRRIACIVARMHIACPPMTGFQDRRPVPVHFVLAHAGAPAVAPFYPRPASFELHCGGSVAS